MEEVSNRSNLHLNFQTPLEIDEIAPVILKYGKNTTKITLVEASFSYHYVDLFKSTLKDSGCRPTTFVFAFCNTKRGQGIHQNVFSSEIPSLKAIVNIKFNNNRFYFDEGFEDVLENYNLCKIDMEDYFDLIVKHDLEYIIPLDYHIFRFYYGDDDSDEDKHIYAPFTSHIKPFYDNEIIDVNEILGDKHQHHIGHAYLHTLKKNIVGNPTEDAQNAFGTWRYNQQTRDFVDYLKYLLDLGLDIKQTDKKGRDMFAMARGIDDWWSGEFKNEGSEVPWSIEDFLYETSGIPKAKKSKKRKASDDESSFQPNQRRSSRKKQNTQKYDIYKKYYF
ncbi:chromatin structure-remodeling complex subunit SFH1 [Acrasis kona]|uniref:Chromatin structure-remodeling complex subunit SFH1 n=1 Tax=Acrasis kona TaxID=1008807 RepID=A0AAW2ZMV1_9EUKA